MHLFVITHGTKDYGDAFVVREHRNGVALVRPLDVCGTLEEARGVIENVATSLVHLPRCDHDDSVIVESWGSRADVDECLALQRALGARTTVECEIELFEDDEHEGAVRSYREYDHDGFKCTRALCDHHHDAQEELGADLRDDLPIGRARKG
jgi:hypothetical protein